jgi:hypothetical protein
MHGLVLVSSASMGHDFRPLKNTKRPSKDGIPSAGDRWRKNETSGLSRIANGENLYTPSHKFQTHAPAVSLKKRWLKACSGYAAQGALRKAKSQT